MVCAEWGGFVLNHAQRKPGKGNRGPACLATILNGAVSASYGKRMKTRATEEKEGESNEGQKRENPTDQRKI